MAKVRSTCDNSLTRRWHQLWQGGGNTSNNTGHTVVLTICSNYIKQSNDQSLASDGPWSSSAFAVGGMPLPSFFFFRPDTISSILNSRIAVWKRTNTYWHCYVNDHHIHFLLLSNSINTRRMSFRMWSPKICGGPILQNSLNSLNSLTSSHEFHRLGTKYVTEACIPLAVVCSKKIMQHSNKTASDNLV